MEVYNKSLCQPRELLVEILQEYPDEVEHIFIPSCVVLTRCAGCCNDEMLQCTPTSTYNVTMEVSNVIWSSNTCVLILFFFFGSYAKEGYVCILNMDTYSVYFCPNVKLRRCTGLTSVCPTSPGPSWYFAQKSPFSLSKCT